jgi:2-polyprenyl-3-methyl-5-hydroxy-6-metoxy-1,4-benzoquinol methylase
MREKLLEVLAEPRTGAPLTLEVERHEGDRILEGHLVSTQTGARFPIIRGIPRFVSSDNYAHSFGEQWNAYRHTQLDSDTGVDISTQRFDDETGWTEAELAGKWCLDAGCGAGRFAEVAASRGPNLVAMDYSSAVEATAQTIAHRENVDVVQGNLLEPPLRMGAFDFAYCIGVIQHTPDPALAARNVVSAVRSGGAFCLTIYARRPWTKLNTKYLIRPLTKRLPQPVLHSAIRAAMPVVFPVADKLFRVPGVGRVARHTIPVAVYTDRDHLAYDKRYEESVLDTLDMLSPQYDSPMTWQEVEVVLRGVGAADWHFNTKVPINVVGRR